VDYRPIALALLVIGFFADKSLPRQHFWDLIHTSSAFRRGRLAAVAFGDRQADQVIAFLVGGGWPEFPRYQASARAGHHLSPEPIFECSFEFGRKMSWPSAQSCSRSFCRSAYSGCSLCFWSSRSTLLRLSGCLRRANQGRRVLPDSPSCWLGRRKLTVCVTVSRGGNLLGTCSRKLQQEWEKEKAMSADTLTITDNRTGKQTRSQSQPALSGAWTWPDQATTTLWLMTYDPAFMNTASCKSRITFIDGPQRDLEVPRLPIEQLAEKSTYLEVEYLLLHGELPTEPQTEGVYRNITYHTFINENIKKVMTVPLQNAHPMGMFEATLGALSTFLSGCERHLRARMSLETDLSTDCQVPTIAAFAYRHGIGMRYATRYELSYEGNFLNMMFKTE